MPIYRYKFCDGTVSDVEVSDEQYALLKAMDEQERANNMRQKRRNVPLASYVQSEERADKKRDNDFKGVNK